MLRVKNIIRYFKKFIDLPFKRKVTFENNTIADIEPNPVFQINEQQNHPTKKPNNYVDIRRYWVPPEWAHDYYSNDCFLNEFKDVYLLSNGVFLNKDGFVKSSFLFPEDITQNELNDCQLLLKKSSIVQTYTGLYLSINHKWIKNYFHWIVDDLPRIFGVKDWINSNDVTIVIPSDAPSFIHESCKIMGLKTLLQPEKHLFKFDSLFHVSLLSPSGLCHPFVAQLDELLKIKRSNTIERKIYISRKNSNLRCVENEETIFPLLKNYGFEIIFAEDMSFEQQISTFRKARVIMGPHGAGLANATFMTANTTIIEIASLDSNENSICYWTLANQKNMDYYYIPCNFTKEKSFWLSESQIRYLEKILKKIFQR